MFWRRLLIMVTVSSAVSKSFPLTVRWSPSRNCTSSASTSFWKQEMDAGDGARGKHQGAETLGHRARHVAQWTAAMDTKWQYANIHKR